MSVGRASMGPARLAKVLLLALALLASSGGALLALPAAPVAAAARAPIVGVAVRPAATEPGYWLAGSDGSVYAFGAAQFQGQVTWALQKPIVGIAVPPNGAGYWLVASDGGVFTFGKSGRIDFHGSLGGTPYARPIVGMASTATGKGYWLVADDGKVFPFGDATNYGGVTWSLNKPIVGIAVTPSGKGYWLAGADGGLFTFGDAPFRGNAVPTNGQPPLQKPIVGIGAASGGYWMVAADGGVFTFGPVDFHGSMGGQPLNQPMTAISPTPSGRGYWSTAADGGVFAFGDAKFLGNTVDGTVPAVANQPPTGTGVRSTIASLAQSYLGFAESEARSAPLRDCPNTEYQVGKWAWATCFASKVWLGAGVEWTQTADAEAVKTQAERTGRWRGLGTPEVGDLIVWRSKIQPGGRAAIVVAVDANYATTKRIWTINGDDDGKVRAVGPFVATGPSSYLLLGYASPLPVTTSAPTTNATTTRTAYVDQVADVNVDPDQSIELPGEPTAVTPTSGHTQVTLSWTAPASNGGSAITGYSITPYKAGVAQPVVSSSGTGTSKVVTGLTNGTSYTFRVAAVNSVGTGSPSAASTAVLPNPTKPGLPTGLVATAGDAQVALSWTAPASNGGSAITGYSITPYKAGVAQPVVSSSGTGTSKVVTGLTNGTSYTFRVAAVNSVGTGSSTAASAAVIPRVSYAPYASWTLLVDALHRELLGRLPTATERSTWVGPLTDGSKVPGDLADALRRSTESESAVDATARLYRAFLGRGPDPSGLEFWISRRRSGSWSLVRMADQFAASNEFARRYGSLTNRQFVTLIYTDVLGRTADPSGVDYWTRQLDLKRRTRGGVMTGFSESSEFRRKQADATDASVASILLLGRAPTAQEASTWASRRAGGTTHAALLGELISSPEHGAHVDGS